MKFVYPEIDYVFDTDAGSVNTLIIENPKLFTALAEDITVQLRGDDGRAVLSENGKILAVDKNCELLTQFVPFSLNTKTLSGKVTAAFEKTAMREDNYRNTMELLGRTETYFYELAQQFNCDFIFSKINISSMIKSAGIELNEDYDSLGEKIIDYFEFVAEFDKPKLFITLNLRSYINNEECEKFIDTVLRHGYNVIMVENCEHKRLVNENRIIIDETLCIIR